MKLLFKTKITTRMDNENERIRFNISNAFLTFY